ncbi:hypothetical protein WR25_07200 [Diploscapter pachys]|uniref:Uncharacterized protein n=1 Tax=Diploscapter pachys TaxID=2018661 RepID=A0A2A2L3J6_9BILA|nr:hypothetical protein WR25_07200 [Diploscapter pachys]
MSTTTTTPDCQAAYGQFGIGWTYWAGDANSDPGCFGIAVSADAWTPASVQGIKDFCTNSGAPGATPASFHSQAQYDFLTTTTRLGSATPAWLNLYYDATGVLMWLDGSTVDYIRAPLTSTDPTTTMQGWFFDEIWSPDDPANGNTNNVV